MNSQLRHFLSRRRTHRNLPPIDENSIQLSDGEEYPNEYDDREEIHTEDERNAPFLVRRKIGNRHLTNIYSSLPPDNTEAYDPEADDAMKLFIMSRRKRLARRLLRRKCRSINLCLALNKYKLVIKEGIFANFRDLSMIDVERIQRIGQDSVNGFVLRLPFVANHRKNTAYAILKSIRKPDADNLWYEYVVGTFFINPLLPVFPCFCETYDLYRYKGNAAFGTTFLFAQDPANHPKPDLPNLLELSSHYINYTNACIDEHHHCVMLQYFENVTDLLSLFYYYRDHPEETNYFLGNTCLYQIYFVLAELQEIFNHNDLHLGNVLLYEPYKGQNKYILMRYVRGNRMVTFKTKYIAKIIDYGQAYFYRDVNMNTNVLLNQVCTMKPDCHTLCSKDLPPHFRTKSRTRDLKAGFFLKHCTITEEFMYPNGFDDVNNLDGTYIPGLVKSVSDWVKNFETVLANDHAKNYERFKQEPLFHNWQHAATMTIFEKDRVTGNFHHFLFQEH